ncbi:MAG: class I SAM-dependent methyltransferase [Acidobacteriota bacterium]
MTGTAHQTPTPGTGRGEETTFTAQIEPFDSFWEAPDDIEKGFASFSRFYRHNYLAHFPSRQGARILVVSSGYGYMLQCLSDAGYTNVVGIDSDPEKIEVARARGLSCEAVGLCEYLSANAEQFDAIFCEQEVNHLTKAEILVVLELLRNHLVDGGTLIVHGLNGANPITGAEALAQNFDHYNSFTEYTMRQVLEHVGFRDVCVFPLDLYVFFNNPLNYVLIAVSSLFHLFFRACFILYGKKNRIFTKKIAASCHR